MLPAAHVLVREASRHGGQKVRRRAVASSRLRNGSLRGHTRRPHSGNPLLHQKPPSKSKTWTTACACGAVWRRAARLWISVVRANRETYNPAAPRSVFHNTSCVPTSGSAAANDSPLNCPNNSSTPGSGRSRPNPVTATISGFGDTKNARGRLSMTRVTLRPRAAFSGEKLPAAEELRRSCRRQRELHQYRVGCRSCLGDEIHKNLVKFVATHRLIRALSVMDQGE